MAQVISTDALFSCTRIAVGIRTCEQVSNSIKIDVIQHLKISELGDTTNAQLGVEV